MRRTREHRPSPAIVLAVVALVFALAGSALAGPAEDAARTAKRALGLAKKADRKARAANRTAVKARKAANDAKERVAQAVGSVVVRFTDDTLPSNEFKQVRVECRSKEQVVSGGWTLTGFQGTDIERVFIFSNGPETTDAGETTDAWIVAAVNRTINGGGIRVYAMCARRA